ncbi:MAG: transporter [Betaproteobacteria bacterium]|nr:transporter [Betaproteobacteria bacterium]
MRHAPGGASPVFFLLAAVMVIALFPAIAAADDINTDRPGIADGSAVVGSGRFQVETGVQQEWRDSLGEKTRTLFAPTLLRLGLGENWEMRIEGNVRTSERVTAADGTSSKSSGDAPVSIGAKYHFAAAEGAQPSLGVIARIFPRSGSGNFRTLHATGDVRLAADWDFAPDWSLNPNIGLARYEDDTNRVFSAKLFAVTLSYNVSNKLYIFLDGAAQTPEQSNGKTMTQYDTGFAYQMTPDTQLDVSVGFKGRGDTPANQFIGAGVSVRF